MEGPPHVEAQMAVAVVETHQMQLELHLLRERHQERLLEAVASALGTRTQQARVEEINYWKRALAGRLL